MKYLNIAARNLSRQKKRSLLLGFAIAFGVMIITLVNGFTTGALNNIKENFSYLLAGHIYIGEEIKRDDGEVIEEFRDEAVILDAIAEITEEFALENVQLVRRSNMFGTMLFSGRQTSQAVQGVDWTAESQLVDRLELQAGSVEEAMNDPRGILISESAAESLNVQLGEEITIRTSTVTGQQNVGGFVVRGIMTDPSFLGALSSYANIDRVNQMINLSEGSYQTLNLTLESLDQVDEVTDALYGRVASAAQMAPRDEGGVPDFSNFSFVFESQEEDPWEGTRFNMENINEFFSILTPVYVAVNGFGYGLLGVILVIIMVGVTNTFRMIMIERIKEIGTMRAVGVQRSGIRRIFLWEAASLGTLGYVIGMILALLATFIVGLFAIPADNAFNLFTFNGRITFPASLISLILNYIFVTLMTVLAASFPASKAAKAQPADALRQ
jgi:putative ABC transport system permease protein